MSSKERKGPPRRGGNQKKSRGGGGSRRGKSQGRAAPNQEKLDDQMVSYWAQSEDPKLKEKAEAEKKQRAELLLQKEQKKLDSEMQEYWKKQKLEGVTKDEKQVETKTG